jgi:hypothetical protein
MTDNSENMYDELPDLTTHSDAPITIIRTVTFNQYRDVLKDVLAFIDFYMEEQGDYSSIELEETAAELRTRVARLIAE